jgi:hypothetical protein
LGAAVGPYGDGGTIPPADPDRFSILIDSHRLGTQGITGMQVHRISWALIALLPTAALGQDSYKIEPLKQAPPPSLAAPIRGVLRAEGYRVLDGQGKTYAEIWLRKAIPASEKPAGNKGAIQFPFLAEGELLGALRFPGEGHDYRDQAIGHGVYTLRYGLQPVNGDHLGVSTYRDYMLLLPAAKDTELANLAKKPLNERSAESAGTSHPSVLILLAAPASSSSIPTMVRDQEKDLWGAVIPLPLEVKGAGASVPTPFNVQLILIGAAMI